MKGALLALLLLQVQQVSTPPSGVVTGVVLSGVGTAAAGVRVYAVPAGDPKTASDAGSVIVGLVQTDALGRYRLEVPAGRYYIAAGSVESPTYYPSESNISSAKIVSVSSEVIVQDVNFSRYVPAPASNALRLPTSLLPPGSTGVLSGILHYPDGSPAVGVPVAAVPIEVLAGIATGSKTSLLPSTVAQIQSLENSPSLAALPSLFSSIRSAGGGIRAVTDNTGRFRIEAVSPDSYAIVAGYADAPAFYPGIGDYKQATAVTTTPTTMLDKLNFNLPALTGNTVRVRVLAKANRPIAGVTVGLSPFPASYPSGISAFLPERIPRPVTTGTDGSAEFLYTPTDQYTLLAKLYPASPILKTVEVQDREVNVDVSFPVNVLSGRVLWEDGKPVGDPVLSQIAVRTLQSESTSIFAISKDGIFNGILSSDEYRFFLRNLPQEFQIRSITSGSSDLTKDALKFSEDRPSDIEVRLSKRPNTAASVTGRIIDAVTGMPLAGDRVQICCFSSGPYERISAEVRSDGSFEFSGVPSGQYEMELKGKTGRILNPDFEIPGAGQTRLNFYSTQQMVSISTIISTDGTVRWPQSSSMTVTFVPTAGEPYRITSTGSADETLIASVPMGVFFDVSISNPPPGIKLKSISGPDSAGKYAATVNSSIVIMLTRGD